MPVHFYDRQHQIGDLLPKLMEASSWGFDTETTGLNRFEDKVIAVQIGNERDQHVIDTRNVNIEPLRPFFESKKVKKVAHNAAFDWNMVMTSFKMDIEGLRCTMMAEQLLHVGRKFSGFGLAVILEERMDIVMSKEERMTFTHHKGPYTENQIEYMAKDVRYLLPLCKIQCADMANDGVGQTWALECEAIAPFESMGLNGFKMDVPAWSGLIKTNADEAEEKRIKMDEFARQYWETDMFGDVCINYGSPKQMLDLLHRMRVTIRMKNHATGKEEDILIPNTNDASLKLVEKVPFIDLLKRKRTLDKMVSTYGQKFLDSIRDDTGRIHFELKQLGTETGRPASRKTSSYNPLNIPRDKRYRHAFIADPDYLIETDDYAACELRIWAEVSQDPGLCEAFRRGEDIHSYVGSKLFKMEVSKTVNSDKRQLTKPVNFGIAYGMGVWTLYYRALGEGLNVTIDEMKALYKTYTQTEFVQGVKYLRETGKSSVERGYATTIGGRRRYWLAPNPNNRETFPNGAADKKYRGVIGSMEREAGNMEIQGTCSDMIKRALRLIYDAIKERGFRTELKNMPYDEIVTMTHKDDSPEFVEIKRKLMIQAAEEYVKTVPMEVEGEVMGCWTK